MKARVAEASIDGDSLPDARQRHLAGLEFLGLAAIDEVRLRFLRRRGVETETGCTHPLREASLRALTSLLDEECSAWQAEFSGDFSDVRAAVAAGIERGTLPGRVVAEGARTLGYCYYMADTGRVIVGSVFAGREHRGRGIEDALVGAVIARRVVERGSGRVECQTLFCTSALADRRGSSRSGFASRPRHYMRRDLREPLPPRRRARCPPEWRMRPLRREDLPAAAEVVYRGRGPWTRRSI